MNCHFKMFLALTLGFAVSVRASEVAVTRSEYRGAKAVARALTRRHDVEKTTFVILGRSPVLVGALLETLGADVRQLPLGELGHATTFDGWPLAGLIDKFWPQTFAPWQIAYLQSHFAHFLPADSLRENSVIVDYYGFGHSLRRAKKLIQDYLALFPNNPKTINVETFAIMVAGSPVALVSALKRRLAGQGYVLINPVYGLGWSLITESHKPWAPYGHFVDYRKGGRAEAGLPYRPPTRNDPIYNQLLRATERRVAEDPKRYELCRRSLE